MTQLCDQLSLDKPPSAEQLVVGENMLISAQAVMQKANKLSLGVAGLKTDSANDMMDTDAAERSSYNRMEHKILIKVNRFKSLYPQLSPAADHTSGTSRAPGDSAKIGAFRFERRSLPKFRSTLREYPTFKKD